MNPLGEARKKLYDAFGEAEPEKAEAVLARTDAVPTKAKAKAPPKTPPKSPSKAKPAPEQKKTAKVAPRASAHKRLDMTRRLAARIAAEMPEGTVASYIPLARVVLSELREPSTGMLEAAFEGQLDYSDNVEDWQRMIDAALEESDLAS